MMQFTTSLYALFRTRRTELRSHVDMKHVENLKKDIAKEREQTKIKAKSMPAPSSSYSEPVEPTVSLSITS